MISQVFYTQHRNFAFQRVGRGYNLYGGEDLHFLRYFRSFVRMCDYMTKHEEV